MIYCAQHGDETPAYRTMIDAAGKKWLACPRCRPEWTAIGPGNMGTEAFLNALAPSPPAALSRAEEGV